MDDDGSIPRHVNGAEAERYRISNLGGKGSLCISVSSKSPPEPLTQKEEI